MDPQNIPNQIPRQVARHFVGRSADLAWINRRLAHGKTLVISATGGMGKTTLVTEAVYQMADNGRLAEQFPDGVIFHTFYGQPQIGLALDAIIRGYGHQPEGAAETQVRTLLAGKKALLLLDGCEDVKEREGLQGLIDLLGRDCGVIITSRTDDHGRLGAHRPLGRLEPAEALELLEKLADKPITANIGNAICKHVDHLPLGVDLAGNYLRETGEPPADYLTWLKKEPVAALDHGETRRRSIYRMIDKSIKKINDQTGEAILLALSQIAYLPAPIWLIEGVLSKEARSLNHPLRDLSRYGLIVHQGNNISCAHALIHSFAGQTITLPWLDWADNEQMLDKVWRWLVENLEGWQTETPPNFGRCDAVRGHVMGVLEELEKLQMWEAVDKLIWAVDGYFRLQGHYTERLIALEMVLRGSRQLADRKGEGKALNNMATTAHARGDYKTALSFLNQSLAIQQEIGDKSGEGTTLNNISQIFKARGDYETALSFLNQSLAIRQEIGDKSGEGATLLNIGSVALARGDYETALSFLNQSLAIRQEIGDKSGMCATLFNIGHIHLQNEERDEAFEKWVAVYKIASRINLAEGLQALEKLAPQVGLEGGLAGWAALAQETDE